MIDNSKKINFERITRIFHSKRILTAWNLVEFRLDERKRRNPWGSPASGRKTSERVGARRRKEGEKEKLINIWNFRYKKARDSQNPSTPCIRERITSEKVRGGRRDRERKKRKKTRQIECIHRPSVWALVYLLWSRKDSLHFTLSLGNETYRGNTLQKNTLTLEGTIFFAARRSKITQKKLSRGKWWPTIGNAISWEANKAKSMEKGSREWITETSHNQKLY